MNFPDVFYHSTINKFLPSIQKRGLIPNSIVKMYSWALPGIYLCESMEGAISFVETTEIDLNLVNQMRVVVDPITDEDLDDIIIFRIETIRLERLSITEDPHCKWSFRYMEMIPFEDLKLITR